LAGFLIGTYGLWTGQEWWRPVLVVASVASIVAALPWWGVMPTVSYLGALAVDAVVLIGIVTPEVFRARSRFRWPSRARLRQQVTWKSSPWLPFGPAVASS
jgi:hypothetical protein